MLQTIRFVSNFKSWHDGLLAGMLVLPECLFLCVCVACFTIFVGCEDWEPTILVGSVSLSGDQNMNPHNLNVCLRVSTGF